MEAPTRVNVTRAQTRIERERDLERVRWLARMMDAQFQVAGFRFGLDALIGLVPAVGDTVAGLLALYPLMVARRHGVSRWVQLKMLRNVAFDWVVGTVPVAGDLFDVAYKANLRNLELLEKALKDLDERGGAD